MKTDQEEFLEYLDQHKEILFEAEWLTFISQDTLYLMESILFTFSKEGKLTGIDLVQMKTFSLTTLYTI